MVMIHVKNLEKYQPKYKDGRRMLWIRWDIDALTDYKITKLAPEQKWLFIGLICLEVRNQAPLPHDEKWLAEQLGFTKNHISKHLQMLQTLELIVKVCNDDIKNPSPTIHTDIQTNNTVQDKVFCFEEIWIKYPNKVGKKEAERHFKASVKTEIDFNNIKTALNNYLVSERVKKGYIQNGSTWFNDWQSWIKQPDRPESKFKPVDPNCKLCKGTGWIYNESKSGNVPCSCRNLTPSNLE